MIRGQKTEDRGQTASFPRSGVGMQPVTLQRHATLERCLMNSHTARGYAGALIVIHNKFQGRHTGMDAGIQSQGCESTDLHFCSIKHLCRFHVTIPSTRFRHPCRNDGTFSARPDLCIRMSGAWELYAQGASR